MARRFDPPVLPSPIPLLIQRDSAVRLDAAARRGEVVRVMRGVYADSAAWEQLPPWDRYRARVHAVTRMRPDAVLCLESASSVFGSPVIGAPNEVHVIGDHLTTRVSGGVHTHRCADRREVIEVAGIRVVAPIDTAVDIARLRHPLAGVAACDAYLRDVDPQGAQALLDVNAARTRVRGRAKADEAIRLARPLAETVLESVSRCVIVWCGFDEPELQVTFLLEDGEARVDMLWRDANVIGEADGVIKYRGEFGDAVEAIRAEKKRERQLREIASMARWGWAEVAEPQKLMRTLSAAGVVQRSAPRDALLAGVRTVLGRRR
ncbi:hypothetical protein [Microbacterium sp. NPDC055683]